MTTRGATVTHFDLEWVEQSERNLYLLVGGPWVSPGFQSSRERTKDVFLYFHLILMCYVI